jgi:hypothetical protein
LAVVKKYFTLGMYAGARKKGQNKDNTQRAAVPNILNPPFHF